MSIDEKALDAAMQKLQVRSKEGVATYRLIVEAYEAAKHRDEIEVKRNYLPSKGS